MGRKIERFLNLKIALVAAGDFAQKKVFSTPDFKVFLADYTRLYSPSFWRIVFGKASLWTMIAMVLYRK